MTQLSNQFAQTPEKGHLDLRVNHNVIPCRVKSDESTALVPGQSVKLVDVADGVPVVTAITADTDVLFGVVKYNMKDVNFPANASVEIATDHSVLYMEASAAIARGAKVMPVVTGSKVATATAGKSILGFAFDKASTNGDLIRVFLLPLQGQVVSGTALDVSALTENSGAIGGTNDGDLPDLTAGAAALTENSGAIGGTNDGDLPDLTAGAAALTENSGAIGGTNDGDLPALVDPNGDAGASVIAGIRENATMINSLVTDNVALRASVREAAVMINSLVTDNVALRASIREVADKVNDMRSSLVSAGLMA